MNPINLQIEINVLLKLFQEIEKEEILPNSLYVTEYPDNILILKLGKNITRKRKKLIQKFWRGSVTSSAAMGVIRALPVMMRRSDTHECPVALFKLFPD